MMNRFFAVLAATALIGTAACADDEPDVADEVIVEEPAMQPGMMPMPATEGTVFNPAYDVNGNGMLDADEGLGDEDGNGILDRDEPYVP